MEEAKKCGIIVNPPTFVMIYKSEEKFRKKTMPLRDFKLSSDVGIVAQELKKKHNLKKIPLVKIKKMLRLLQELIKGTIKSEAITKIEKEFELKVNEDLNKLSTNEINLQKELMESLFLKNQIKQNDDKFEYDRRIDFSDEKEKSNWDLEENDDNFWVKN